MWTTLTKADVKKGARIMKDAMSRDTSSAAYIIFGWDTLSALPKTHFFIELETGGPLQLVEYKDHDWDVNIRKGDPNPIGVSSE